MASVYCALVHYPVADRGGETVATSVTNLDVHDIARSARTYGLRGYFVVSPMDAQRPVVERILEHWTVGDGRRRIPERGEALALVEVCASIEDASAAIAEREGRAPRVVATTARQRTGAATFASEARTIRGSEAPTLLLFGTGHGLTEDTLRRADAVLEPIFGSGDWNHLSVRAAAAIVFDRLLAPC